MNLIDAYRKKLAGQIKEHKAQLDVLKVKARKFAADSKIVGEAELALADKHLDEAKAKFNELKGAGGVAFQEIRSGVKKALADLQVSTRKAAKHLAAHAAPAGTLQPKARGRAAKSSPAKSAKARAK